MRIAVLRGGPSNEFDVSLKTGATVLQHLPAEKYDPRDIFIDRAGTWHVRGFPVEPARAIENTDCVINALHGAYGEDGQIQKLLDTFSVPYTGSGALASALGMHKVRTKERARAVNIPTALHVVLHKDDASPTKILSLFREFPQPSVIKPAQSGSSVGVTFACSYDDFFEGIQRAHEHSDDALIEEHIPGVEATCGVIDRFRNEEHYALPPIEIIPKGATFFNYDAKYGGMSQELCPARFDNTIKEKLLHYSRAIHRELGLRHYSRADFIIAPSGTPYFLETNTLPGLTPESLLPKGLACIGSRLDEFLDHLVTLAISDR